MWAGTCSASGYRECLRVAKKFQKKNDNLKIALILTIIYSGTTKYRNSAIKQQCPGGKHVESSGN